MSLRATLRRGRAELEHALGSRARDLRRLDGSRAVVLTYHRVLPRTRARERAIEPGMFVTPESFRSHLFWLREHFAPTPLHELIDALEHDLPFPERAVALTFDDGWRDNLEFALPHLRSVGVPATVFLVAERVGTLGGFWTDELCRRLGRLSPRDRVAFVADWGARPGEDPVRDLLADLKERAPEDREKVLSELRERTGPAADEERELLDWAEVESMAREGVEFESHGASHAILPTLDPAEARRELESARQRLEARGHGRHRILAYPSGAHDARTRFLAREAGYRAALTTRPGFLTARSDRLALPRTGVHEDISGSRAEFLARLLRDPSD